MAQLTMDGAEHAIRWILAVCPRGSNRPGADWMRKDDEALALLWWGIDYAHLYIDHTAWSRGMMTPLVDEEAKVVEFQVRRGGERNFFAQIESDERRVAEFMESMPPQLEADILSPWIRGLRGDDIFDLPQIPINDDSRAYRCVAAWANAVVLPEIEGNRDLGGFSLAEFRQFYSHLWIFCHCISKLEKIFDQAVGHENPFGSRLLQGGRQRIAYWISRYCRIPVDTACAILDLLSFRCEHRHPSLSGHPFVPTTDGAITMLASQFARTDPNLMLATAMNAGSGRRIYESIIEEIELATKRQVAAHLRKCGYAVWDNPRLARAGAVSLTPDFVVSRDQDEWVAVVEYKHSLPPRGAAAVSDRIRESTRWILKAQRYRDAADQQVVDIESQLGLSPQGRKVLVAVVARWPMPIPIEVGADRVTLTDLGRVNRAASEQEHVHNVFGEGEMACSAPAFYAHRAISVGDWTYRIPILAADNGSGTAS